MATLKMGSTTVLTDTTLANAVQDNITRLGTVTSGTSQFGLIDPSVDSWEMYMGDTDVNQSGTTSVVDFFQDDNIGRLGSNITESAGAVTIGTAGWYFMWFTLTVSGTQSQTVNCGLTKNGTAEADRIGHRLYMSDNQNGGNFRGKTVIVVAELAATDVMRVCGSGYFYASTAARDTMSSFQGFRLGA